jgi:hypothetical protein
MANTYSLIASNVLSSAAASVTFSAIPATYTDLVLRMSARRDVAAASGAFRMRFNGLTTTIYSYTDLTGSGSAAASARASGSSAFLEPETVGNTATSNTFSSHEFYIPSYTASQNKPMSAFSVAENNTTAAEMSVAAYLLSSTAAINEILIYPPSGNFMIGSSFYLYGIKNS